MSQPQHYQSNLGRATAQLIDCDSLNVTGRLTASSVVVGSSGVDANAAWVSYTPSLSPGTFATSGTINARYTVIGKTMHMNITMTRANNTGGVNGSASQYSLTLPTGIRSRQNAFINSISVGSGSLSVASVSYNVEVRLSALTTEAFLVFVISKEDAARAAWSPSNQGFETAGAMTLTACATFEIE
jgi:hypothetical protein